MKNQTCTRLDALILAAIERHLGTAYEWTADEMWASGRVVKTNSYPRYRVLFDGVPVLEISGDHHHRFLS